MKLKKIHPRTTKLLSSTGRGEECACVFLNVYRSESDLYPCDRGRVYGSKAIQFGEKGPLGKKNIKSRKQPHASEESSSWTFISPKANLPLSLCIDGDLDKSTYSRLPMVLLYYYISIYQQ